MLNDPNYTFATALSNGIAEHHVTLKMMEQSQYRNMLGIQGQLFYKIEYFFFFNYFFPYRELAPMCGNSEKLEIILPVQLWSTWLEYV